MPRSLRRGLIGGAAAVLLLAIAYGTLRPMADPPFPLYEPWLAHLVAFFLLGLMVWAAICPSGRRRGWVAGGLVLAAAGSEIGQFWVPIREPALLDVLLNLVGVGSGAFLAMLFNPNQEEKAIESQPASLVPPSAAGAVAEQIRQLTDDRLLHALPMLARRREVSPAVAAVGRQVLKGMPSAGNEPEADRAVFRALADAGVRTLAMKGTLLAWTVYDHPDHRFRGDTDLLVTPEQREQAEEVLRGLGLKLGWEVTAKTSHTQDQWVGEIEGKPVMIDLHWQVLNHPAFAQVFDFGSLWKRKSNFAIEGQAVHGLSPQDALLHAALHYYVHHGDDFRPAQWLLDGELIWNTMNQHARAALSAEAERTGVSGILGAYLAATRHRFGTEIPEPLIEQLTRTGRNQWRSGILALDGRPIRAQMFTIRALEGWPARFAHVRALLLPNAKYMLKKYPGVPAWRLPWLYFRRAFDALKS